MNDKLRALMTHSLITPQEALEYYDYDEDEHFGEFIVITEDDYEKIIVDYFDDNVKPIIQDKIEADELMIELNLLNSVDWNDVYENYKKRNEQILKEIIGFNLHAKFLLEEDDYKIFKKIR